LNSWPRGVASCLTETEAVLADKPDSAAAEIAKDANAHILALDAGFREVTAHALVQDEEPISLFCECGCLGIVATTRADYAEAGGAWLEGHRPKY
jgi:hypothetical protein